MPDQGVKKGCGILGGSVALSLYEAGKSTKYTKKKEEEEEEQCSEDTK
jgi:prephenate dehydrogenase